MTTNREGPNIYFYDTKEEECGGGCNRCLAAILSNNGAFVYHNISCSKCPIFTKQRKISTSKHNTNMVLNAFSRLCVQMMSQGGFRRSAFKSTNVGASDWSADGSVKMSTAIMSRTAVKWYIPFKFALVSLHSSQTHRLSPCKLFKIKKTSPLLLHLLLLFVLLHLSHAGDNITPLNP